MKKIIVIIILSVILAFLIFVSKDILDLFRNAKAFVDVKLSEEYSNMDSDKLYYKNEKNIKIPILIYHEIKEKKPTRDLFYMQTTAKRFEEQIKGLLEEGYDIISYDDLIEYNEGNKALKEKTLLIGFDDGWMREL